MWPLSLFFSHLYELYLELKDKGFQIIGISQDANLEDAKRFAERFGIKFPLVWDNKNAYTSRLEIPKMPTAFLVDRTGKIVAVHGGFTKLDEQLKEKILKLLGEEADE